MNSGMIVDRRDHVLITFFSLRRLRSSTLCTRWASTNGPFLIERDISLPPHHDEAAGPLVAACLIAARGLSPGRNRMTAAGGFAFAAAVRMIHRVHRDAP